MNERGADAKEKQISVGYKDIFIEKEFMKQFLAKIISRFGDSIDIVAYGWMVFQLTGSAVILATLYAVSGIPSFLFNIISGVVVTYLPKKTVIYICDFGRGVVVLITALLYMTGHLAVWHLFVFAFLNSSFEAFRTPAAMPLFASLISKEKYDYAVSTNTTGITLAELMGYSVAGVLIGTVGVAVVIIIDAITFFISGLLILSIKISKEELSKNKLTLKGYFLDLKSGFNYVLSNRLILSICLFAGGFNLFIIPFNALQPAYVDEILNRGPEAISVMAISFLIPMIVGGILAPIIKKRVTGKKMMIFSGVLISIGYLCLSQMGMFRDSNLLYLGVGLSCGLMGISVPILSLPLQVGIMSKVDREYLPRTASLINALSLSTTPIGGGIVGFIITFIALKHVFVLFSIGILMVFILQIFNPSLKEI